MKKTHLLSIDYRMMMCTR